MRRISHIWFAIALCMAAMSATGQSYNVQCPAPTAEHPRPRCTHLSGGDGFITMADSTTPTYIFGFSSLCRRLNGNPCNEFALANNAVGAAGEIVSKGIVTPINSLNSGNRLLTDPAQILEEGTLAANESAPTIAVDEDDDFYLTLSNVAMAMRPDLFDGHTVHWHGFAQAASIFDGLPDASVAVIPGASITYYYKVQDAGTYMYHCHVEATEHMQMGMLGNLYVRPRQNRLPDGTSLGSFIHHTGYKYAYNDGDGSTRYDVEFPVQMAGFDPDFHQADLTFQPLPFSMMKDRYFLLNGRSYPDTIDTGIHYTVAANGVNHPSQPLNALIRATKGERILLRISNLSVTQFNTLATAGIPMEVVGLDARHLRADDGTNLHYKTNSITIGGGQTADVILDTSQVPVGTYFLYTTNLNQLANDSRNIGGMMTEIRVHN